jgi:hypothetical protein
MIRLLLFAILALTGIVSAQADHRSPLTTPLPPSRPLTAEQLTDLQRQAYTLMRKGKFDLAGARLDRVYNAVPATQRSRALVLNHAILDLVQKRLVMRGMKDLADYLAQHRGDDEEATNILGALLEMAAGKPGVKAGAMWQAAFREWDRRNFVLDHSRPGWRRWGVMWVSEEEQNMRDARREGLRQAIIEQADRIDRQAVYINSLIEQHQRVSRSRSTYGYLQGYVQQVQSNPTLELLRNGTSGSGGGGVTDAPLRPELEDRLSVQQIEADIAAAVQDLQLEQSHYRDLEKQEEVFRPTWPTRFDPVDPDAPPPAPPATTAPAATRPAYDASPGGLYDGAVPAQPGKVQ